MTRGKALTYSARLLAGAALGALMAGGALAQSINDEIVVTAQRTEQSLQDVPIAVSAFGDQELKDRQIETFSDIQFNVPNFAFSKSQFTTSSIVLRGVGALAVGSDTEPAVSVHENDISLNAPRLFETEFYDVERIEILRGPQGTLFGRNATAGVINVITNKADPTKTGGYIDAEYGNFNSVKVQGAFNMPLGDRLALRLAGTTIQRDGYTTNVFTGQKIDDRNINSIRASVRWLPTDNTTVDFTSSYMRENDHRMRSQKQACEAGPLQPLLGCDPSGPRAFNVPQDLNATFAANFSNEAIALITGSAAAGAAFGVHSVTVPFVSDVVQPTDLRKVAYDTTPKYNAEESLFLVNVKHDWDQLSLKVNAGYGNSKVASRNDFDGGVGPLMKVPPALATLPGVFALYSDGKFPVSQFNTGITTEDNGLTGVISGAIQSRSNRYQAIDLSIGETDYWSTEAVLTSSFDGPFNFLLGSNHAQSNGFADYGVA
ncbi:MAG TPA: TonB-dependent receptor, partial [Parvularculaceae bacterium]|nr:TonB-dependent receptor [Parvularculaceae bacterium]